MTGILCYFGIKAMYFASFGLFALVGANVWLCKDYSRKNLSLMLILVAVFFNLSFISNTWFIFNSGDVNYIDAVKVDTISRKKDLNYLVAEEPGNYVLTLKVQNVDKYNEVINTLKSLISNFNLADTHIKELEKYNIHISSEYPLDKINQLSSWTTYLLTVINVRNEIYKTFINSLMFIFKDNFRALKKRIQ